MLSSLYRSGIVAAVSVFCAGSISVSVFAVTNPAINPGEKRDIAASKQEAEKLKSKLKSCDSIQKMVTNLQSRLEEKQSKISAKRAEIALKANQRYDEKQTGLTTKKQQWDEKRAKQFERLRNLAKSEEQKKAVEEYISGISAAINTRRTANDEAIKLFRTNMTALRSDIGQSVEQAISVSAGEINQIRYDALQRCANGESPENIRKSIKDTLASIRSEVKAARETTGKAGEIKALVQQRNSQLKLNNEKFRQDSKTIRNKLKSAFKKPIDSKPVTED